MSGPPRIKSMNFDEQEARPVLGPAGNKARSIELRKPKSEKTHKIDESKGKKSPVTLQSRELTSEKIPSPVSFRKNGSTAASILTKRQPNLSMSASCSSDASSSSSHSRASMGRVRRGSGTPTPPSRRKQQCSSKRYNNEVKDGHEKSDGVVVDGAVVKKRCAWVTSNTDKLYSAFHDEEWGVPVHDDKKLFELLCFSISLAELTWPVILSRRHIFRDVFLEFDPIAVSKLNEKKISTPGSLGSSLLSELKLRAIVENARQICKIIDEFVSFDKYIWGFVNYKPTVGNFRYPRQVPIKTSKSDAISKDLVRRGFRGVGPTVIYSFMQVVGITNDHLISCFRHQECTIRGDLRGMNKDETSKNDERPPEDVLELGLVRELDDLSLSR
ncbi:hypothetical protein ACS0TY_034169 [Phlomoides rotata]